MRVVSAACCGDGTTGALLPFCGAWISVAMEAEEDISAGLARFRPEGDRVSGHTSRLHRANCEDGGISGEALLSARYDAIVMPC